MILRKSKSMSMVLVRILYITRAALDHLLFYTSLLLSFVSVSATVRLGLKTNFSITVSIIAAFYGNKMARNVAVFALSITLGLLFVLIGIIKLTPAVSPEMHKEMVRSSSYKYNNYYIFICF